MPLRFVRRLRNNMAQSLVLYVKSDARCGRRLAAPIPSSNKHITFISIPRIGFRIRLRLPQLFIINYSLLIVPSNAVAAMTAFVHYLSDVKIFRISSKIACGEDEKHS